MDAGYKSDLTEEEQAHILPTNVDPGPFFFFQSNVIGSYLCSIFIITIFSQIATSHMANIYVFTVNGTKVEIAFIFPPSSKTCTVTGAEVG